MVNKLFALCMYVQCCTVSFISLYTVGLYTVLLCIYVCIYNDVQYMYHLLLCTLMVYIRFVLKGAYIFLKLKNIKQ